MAETSELQGRRILIVEDEYFLAQDMVTTLSEAGAEVLGPVGEIEAALDLIDDVERLDLAVLDLNLRGEMAFPVADALTERNVPIVFATGYDQAVIPARFATVQRHEKPVNARKITQALLKR